ncbi:MAG TPA: hypothetical protein VLK58_08550, partial [Conexibacter sp.]|nr:hypothetical protein [Conexibacter sp.]
MITNKLAPLSLLLLALLLVRPPTAESATYTVHSCKTPSGVWVGAEGWSATVPHPTQGRDPGIAERCTSGAIPLELRFGDLQTPVENGATISLRFTPALNTDIASASVMRRFALDWPVVPGLYGRPYIYDAWHDDDHENNQLELLIPEYGSRAESESSDREVPIVDLPWGSVNFRLRCWFQLGANLCGPSRPTLTIDRATFQLRDVLAPTLTSDCCAARVRGVVGIEFDAADAGGGVYRSILEIDGVETARAVVDGNDGRCGDVEPDTADAYEFAAPRPCPLTAAGSVEFDSATLTDGAHTIVLRVEDAAGNLSAPVQRTVTTHNAPISLSAPWLGGDPRIGGLLFTDAGAWDGAPDDFDYRWLRCDTVGANCVAIVGASGAQYAPTAADAYHRLVAEVAAGNDSGSAVARSAPSDLVADADGRTAPDSPGRPSGPGGGEDRGGNGDDGGRGGPGGSGGPAAGPSGGGGDGGSGGVAGIPTLQNPLGDQAGRTPNGR